MSKKKGLGVDEKRNRMLQLFHETGDFFQLKELEKIAPKEKGIVVQSVKDIVQSLVDDGLIDSDKIGTSIYYWSYPSKILNEKKRKLEEVEEKLSDLKEKVKKQKEMLNAAKLEREDTEERQNLLKELKELKALEKDLKEKFELHKKNDPEVIEKLKLDIKALKDATNRYTDNIFAIKSWCKKKFMIDGDVIDKQFGIPSDFDYVD